VGHGAPSGLSLKHSSNEYLALYGSLMRCFGGLDRLDCSDFLTFVGPCQIGGRLVNLGAYPGLVPGAGIVEAELFEVKDSDVFRRLDEFEGYDPRDLDGSLVVRELIRLRKIDCDAWAYVYNQDIDGKPIVPGGTWWGTT
jgi:gamma-glutamylcyclotransferase (GGCT)/AIG2-like uncharacterized protein YtfP